MSNFVIGNPSFPQVKLETSYHGISGCLENNTFLRKTALEELMTHMPFTQLRFHCSKVRGRTFHVTTAANSSGEAVVQYLSGQTNDEPDSCGSFVRMEDDNSKLAEMCDQWKGGKGEGAPLGKWGEDSLYDHTGCYTREDLNVMTSVMRESLFNCRQAIFGRFLCVSLSHM